ncbi:MAG: UTP--glucose-1-phosphate uridylyltransferase [Oxalobacter sp.]|nr:MAG: UTP--glucose-1-phosphate uridylyltransferase [Oxalobacter sp.]
MKKITKAVFPVAGFGSRFLPATKAQPKEMLPVVDKPLIQYAVEEAVAAGMTEMIFVTGRNKRAIEDHFDKAYELETELGLAGKTELLNEIQDILPKHVSCIFIRQSSPLGLGHAVLCARPVVGVDPFSVILADDLMDPKPGMPGVMAQMLEVYEREKTSILAVKNVPPSETNKYGIVSVTPYKSKLDRVNSIVEKPAPKEAPSNLAVVGRYVLNNAIFDYLEKVGKGSGGEIQLTDGISMLMQSEPVMAYHYSARRYDCGSKLGYLQATVAFGLKHPEVGEAFSEYIDEISQAD